MNAMRRILLVVMTAVTLAPVAAVAETVRLKDASSLRGRLVRVDGDSLTFRLSVGATVPLYRAQLLSILFDDSTTVPAPAPGAAPAEIIRLRDGSSLTGRLVRVDGDSLTVHLGVGPTVGLHRSQVLAVVFYEMATPALPAPAAGEAAETGSGTIEVVFKDRELSSKISIELKKDWDGHVKANHIVVEFLVDGVVAFTSVDTTMDKRIYKGHETQLKNEIELPDFTIAVPAGMRQCKLIVRNRGADEYREDFDAEPLHMVLAFNNLVVSDGEISRLDVGLARGKLKMGKPRFYRIE
jgi:hypothetical protein